MTPIDFYVKDMAKNIVYLEKVRVRDINHLRNRITAAVGSAGKSTVEFDYRLDVCRAHISNITKREKAGFTLS